MFNRSRGDVSRSDSGEVREGDEMSKLTANEELILSELRARLAVAEQEERDAATELRLASAIVAVHRANLEAAEKLLIPKERKKPENAPASPPALKEPATDKEETGGECAKKVGDHVCRLPRENALHHDTVYQYFHDFESPKSVARATRKSKQKSEGTSSDQSSGTVTESAGVAALAASGGD